MRLAALALLLAACGGDNTSVFQGDWEYTGGEGTYSCSTGASGTLHTRVGAVMHVEDEGETLRLTYPGNCPEGFQYDRDGRSMGGECRYATDSVSAFLRNTVGSRIEVGDDGGLTDTLSQHYVFSYPEDPDMTCQVFSVGTAVRL